MFKAAVEHSLGSLDRRNFRSRTVERKAAKRGDEIAETPIREVRDLKSDFSTRGKIPVKIMPAKVSSKQLESVQRLAEMALKSPRDYGLSEMPSNRDRHEIMVSLKQ